MERSEALKIVQRTIEQNPLPPVRFLSLRAFAPGAITWRAYFEDGWRQCSARYGDGVEEEARSDLIDAVISECAYAAVAGPVFKLSWPPEEFAGVTDGRSL